MAVLKLGFRWGSRAGIILVPEPPPRAMPRRTTDPEGRQHGDAPAAPGALPDVRAGAVGPLAVRGRRAADGGGIRGVVPHP